MSDSPQTPAAGPTPDGVGAWRRLLRMGAPRLTRANVMATLLAIGLGYAIAAQVHSTDAQGLENLREDELVRILDDINQSNDRMNAEVAQLRATRDQLSAGATSAEALQAAQQRLDALRVLAGTVPVTGPGIIVTIIDPQGRVEAPLLLDAIEELRDAGAEAISINDVRVVSSTYLSDQDGGVLADTTRLADPYVIRAIGDPATLSSAMDIPGGVSESVRRVDAQSSIDQSDQLTITAVHTLSAPNVAKPVTEASP